MNNISKTEVIEIVKRLKSWDSAILPQKNGPYKAVLANALEPNGLVHIIDKDNIVTMSLPRENYNAIVKENYVN